MHGGIVVVRGNAGERAGDHMRRGTIIIEGNAGPYAGARMIAGTLIVLGEAGPLPGFLLKRGTIVLGSACGALSPTFVDCGVRQLLANRFMATMIESYSKSAAKPCAGRLGGLTAIWRCLAKARSFSETARMFSNKPS